MRKRHIWISMRNWLSSKIEEKLWLPQWETLLLVQSALITTTNAIAPTLIAWYDNFRCENERASSTSLTAEASVWQVMKEMSGPVTRSRTSSLVFLEAWPINQPSHRRSRPHPCETRRVSRIRIWRQTRAQEEEGIITLCLVAHLRGTYPYSHFLGSRKKSFGKTLKSSKLWTSLITLRSYLY